MSKMVRKQVYIESKQESRLKRMARELGLSEAELIRQGINRCFERPLELPYDLSAWKEEKAFIRQWITKGKVKGQRRWTREDLYDG